MDSDISEKLTVTTSFSKSKGRRRTVYLSSTLAATGGFVTGYDVGAIASILALPTFLESFPDMDVSLQSVLLMVTLAAGAIGAFSSGYFCDHLSRRYTIVSGAFVMVLGMVLQIIGLKSGLLFTGRIISSFGGGMITCTIPLYHSEIAPADIRGRLISLFSVMNSMGTLVGYFVTFGTSYLTTSWGWRAVWLIQCILCAALGLFACYLPFSPRWLIDHNRFEEALQILSNLRELPVDDKQLQAEYNEIQQELELEKGFGKRTYIELFKKENLMRTYMSAGLAAGSALTGTQAVSYYAPAIFKSAGFSDVSTSLAATGGLGAASLLGTCVTVLWLDKFGRRVYLISGAFILFVAMIIIGVMFSCYADVDSDGNITMHSISARNVVIAFLFLFNFVYNATLEPISFVLPAEVYNMRCRAKGLAFATGLWWICAIFTTLIMPPLSNTYPASPYYLFAGCSFVVAIMMCTFPESKDLTLEQMEVIFTK
ncbi:hypothetical protein NQZ79_g1536 [Umbelopsis isabellina]|nr:hypothetical protein NQZ79_g1536 [Umbelopsis isabellina]